ncbi:MAG: hypothetical protein S0880_19385 [Actinomycetota bacterium]|nr:hypothetical protein [Actinomycetota bacterium]
MGEATQVGAARAAHRRRWVAALAALIVALAGCGGEDGSLVPPGAPTSARPAGRAVLTTGGSAPAPDCEADAPSAPTTAWFSTTTVRAPTDGPASTTTEPPAPPGSMSPGSGSGGPTTHPAESDHATGEAETSHDRATTTSAIEDAPTTWQPDEEVSPGPAVGGQEGRVVAAPVAGFDLRPALVVRDRSVRLELDVPDAGTLPRGAAELVVIDREIRLAGTGASGGGRWSVDVTSAHQRDLLRSIRIGFVDAAGAPLALIPLPCLGEPSPSRPELEARARGRVAQAAPLGQRLAADIDAEAGPGLGSEAGRYGNLLDLLDRDLERLDDRDLAVDILRSVPLERWSPVSPGGVGPVRLGLTLHEVRVVTGLDPADDDGGGGAGCASVAVFGQPDLRLLLVPRPNDPDAAIVAGVVLDRPGRRTADGLAVGDTADEVRRAHSGAVEVLPGRDATGEVLVAVGQDEDTGLGYVTDGAAVTAIRAGYADVVRDVAQCPG